MIFDKNVERLKALERLQAGAADREALSARMARIREAGPDWWIGYYDAAGRRRREKSPTNTQAAAEKFERQQRAAVERGQYDARDVRHVRVSVVVDAYLAEHMSQKRSYAAAKSLGGYVKKHIGDWWLDRIDATPALLVNHFSHFPERSWSPKYRYNYFLLVRAAINHWIRFRRLIMKNPCDLVVIEPDTRVMDYVPTRADFDALYMASLTAGLPDWIRHLFTAVWETGLRINEILQWQAADIVLAPDSGLPYFWTVISKQKRRMRKAFPMSRPLYEALQEQLAGRRSGRVWPYENPPYKLLNHIPQENGATRSLMDIAGAQIARPFHDFRKSFKLRLKQQGCGKEITKAIQGHATDSMDDYYTHFQREDLEVAVRESWTRGGKSWTPNSHQDDKKGA